MAGFVEASSVNHSLSIYPNLAAESIQISGSSSSTLTIYNLLGQEVLSMPYVTGVLYIRTYQ